MQGTGPGMGEKKKVWNWKHVNIVTMDEVMLKLRVGPCQTGACSRVSSRYVPSQSARLRYENEPERGRQDGEADWAGRYLPSPGRSGDDEERTAEGGALGGVRDRGGGGPTDRLGSLETKTTQAQGEDRQTGG